MVKLTDSADLPATDGQPRLLVTRLLPPRTRSDLVPRPRLLELLERGSDRKLTLISTPPGYGKSTLASQWIKSSGRAAAWVSLDVGDNDPAVLFRYIVAAIQTIDTRLCAETTRMLTDRTAIPTRDLVASFINDLSAATRPFFLVLDDLHLIVSPELLDGLAELLQHSPRMLRLLTTTRNDPPFPLLKMRAQGELLELRASDLCFLLEETRTLLCERYELALTADELQFLHSRTEGWPVGLTLVGQTLHGQSTERTREFMAQLSGNLQFLDEYLWAESLERQPTDRRTFLLQTSILSQFNAQVCDAVTGSTHSAETLRTLERENLFLIALEGQSRWYRYHHLFADVLRHQLALQMQEEDRLELHRKAAHWYEESGFVEEAASHAIAGKQWDLAVRMVKSLCADLFERERLPAIRGWLQPLPLEVLKFEPDLCYWLAWALMRSGHGAEAMQALEMAERAWTEAGDEIGMGKALQIRILADLYQENVDRGIELCFRALALLPEENVRERGIVYLLLGHTQELDGEVTDAEHAFLQARALFQRSGHRGIQLLETTAYGGNLMMRAKLHEPAALFRRVLATGDEWNDLSVQHALFLLGSVYIEWDQLTSAEELLTRAIELADQMSAPLFRARIHQTTAELAFARDDPETAFAEIDLAIDYAISVGAQTRVRFDRALMAEYWIANKQLSLARGWALETGLDPLAEPDYVRMREYLAVLRLLSLEGQQDLVLRVLDPVQNRAEQAGRNLDLLNMLLIRTIAEHEMGNADASAAAMERALLIGGPEGFVRTFLKEGSHIIAPLEMAIAREVEQYEHAQFLLQLVTGASLAMPVQPDWSTELLTSRELEVLKLVSSGLSNRDIADTLFISEHTVKKHLNNMFHKLEVSSRTQLLARVGRIGPD